ncbi:MAG: hypothetical protein ABF242_04230 [Flavobacteriales bacterium]
MKTLLPFVIIIGFGLITFFMTREKSKIDLISEVYSSSMNCQDSLKIIYKTDSNYYDLNKYCDGQITYSGTYFSKSNLPYIETFMNRNNRTTITKVYRENGMLEREIYNLIIGEYTLKEWDSLGILVSDTIKKKSY